MASFFKFGSTAAKKDAYIPPEKRGEINILREALSDPNLDKDVEKKRELLQTVISYVTMGIDTTKLFEKIILVSFQIFKYQKIPFSNRFLTSNYVFLK